MNIELEMSNPVLDRDQLPDKGSHALRQRRKFSFSSAYEKSRTSNSELINTWLYEHEIPLTHTIFSGIYQGADEINDEKLGVVRHNTGPSSAVFFVLNWKKLWIHFATDPRDEFGANYPFFRDIAYVLFHGRTFRLAWYIFLYLLIIVGICFIISPQYAEPVAPFILSLNSVFITLYTWLFVVYKGPLLYREMLAPNVLKQPTKVSEFTTGLIQSGEQSASYGTLWLRGLYAFGREMFPMYRSTTSSTSPSVAAYHPSTHETCENLGFYQLLNVAVKFVIFRHQGCHLEGLDKVARKSICVFGLLSIISSGHYIYTILSNLNILRGCWYDIDTEVQSTRFCALVSFLYATTLFGAVVFALTIILWIATMLGLLGISFATISILQLTSSWCKRYAPLRQVCAHTDEDDETLQALGSLLRRDSIESYLFQQEFMRQIGHRLSTLLCFTFLLAMVSIVLSLYSLIASEDGETYYTNENLVIQTYSQMAVVIVMYLFPPLCIANSNVAIDRLEETIRSSGFDDFSIIGGRQEWLDFIKQNPCLWKVFGVPITFNYLGVMTTSIVLTLLYAMGPEFFVKFVGLRSSSGLFSD